ncbi:hypothetical protein CIK52_16960 [Kocuria rosea]|nr:hypothetical protein CIK52_16960 [Kocuria rosea]QCY33583.1 hypothetical protein EQG70_12520 [Kocuria rosea]
MRNVGVRSVQGDESSDLNAGEFLEVLRRRWWVLLVMGMLGALVGFGIGMNRPTVYETTASGVLVPTGDVSVSEVLAGENLAKSRAITYESVSKTRPVAESVVAELGFEVQPETLLPLISTSVPVNTSEIRVTAQSSTPEAAQQLADAWILALSSQVEAFNVEQSSDQGGPGRSVLRLVPVGSAYLPGEPTSPRMPLLVGGGALVGLLVGLTVAVSETGLKSRGMGGGRRTSMATG